ncbi:H/ACA RNA-protein complex component Gar1 [Methanolobus psychrophilus R15]|nr:H/ACA RNA-protein complex component Gar1 [Methanolobus psychrophilus R15]
MKRLGKVLHLSKQDDLIIRGETNKFSGSMKEMPRIHSFVLDKSIKRIGKVTGVFGPVDWPYYIVKPNKGIAGSELQKMVNERVYVQ